MKSLAILIFICVNLRGADTKSLGASTFSEIWRGFVDGIRENTATTGPCLDVIPQLETIASNMNSRLQEGDLWGVFFEVVDYSAEFVILIDKCQMPEFVAKVKRVGTDAGVSELMLKVGQNMSFYIFRILAIRDAFAYSRYYELGMSIGLIASFTFDYNI